MLELLQRNFGFAWAVGIVMAVAMAVFAAILELPIWDPDSIVPGYIRMPAIVLAAILVDVIPRVLWRSRRSLAGCRAPGSPCGASAGRRPTCCSPSAA